MKQRTLWGLMLALALMLCALPGLADGLTVERTMELDYARNFSVDYCEGGYKLITISDGSRFLTIPEGAEAPADLDADIVALQLPLSNLLVSSTPVTSLINALGALDTVTLTTTAYDSWYIDDIKVAMDAGKLTYVGKYKEPDFEMLAAAQPPFAIFSTMLNSVPDVGEKLIELGIPYMLDQSTFEDHPLARIEWVKLFGALLGREAEAEAIYSTQVELVDGISANETGKSVAMFYITSKGDIYSRNGGDYMAKMIQLAGGEYALAGLNPEKTGAEKIEMEEFYAQAGDADYIIYIWSLGGKPANIQELVAINAMLGEFKAVQNGNVWCTTPDFFQISDTLGNIIVDMNKMLENTDESVTEFTYLFELQ